MAFSDAASASSDSDSSSNLFPYSRDEYVAAITDFYTVVTNLHIPRSTLKHPPPGGWPNITPESCAGFGKSDFVVDLLKHLPYISDGEPRSLVTQVHYKCNVLDYSVVSPEEFSSDRLKLGELVAYSDEDPATADTVVLAEGYESGGFYILLNTATGEVIEEMIQYNRTYEDDAMTYFATLVEDYRTLRLIPVPGFNTIDLMADVSDVPAAELPDPRAQDPDKGLRTETNVRWLRHIYRKHGWPGADYRKEEALKAVADYMEQTPYGRIA
ncbi:hypothetical protein DL770_007323 [Monosporascus sp. CRB-9-2]|nr:hypothetical protein DL770_007323 [Monosporascus sp. CRB-9-2]